MGEEMNEFEKASSAVSPHSYEMDHENVIEFEKDAKVATVTFCQGRYVSKIKKLAEKYPDQVEITSEKKNTIVAHVPVSWVKVNPPKQMNLSDERKEELANRLARIRENRTV